MSLSTISMLTSMVTPSKCSKVIGNNNYLNHFHQHPNYLFQSCVASNGKNFDSFIHNMAYENLVFSSEYPRSFVVDDATLRRSSLVIPVSERRKFFERVAEYNTSF